MEKELTKIFHKAKYEEEHDLAENVWSKLVARNKKIIRIKLWVFSVIGLTSLAGLIPAWNMLTSNLSQSGFYEYVSLAFSSTDSLISYWKEFVFSIAESLPTMSIAISLSLVFVFFLSFRYVIKQIINNNSLGRTYGIA